MYNLYEFDIFIEWKYMRISCTIYLCITYSIIRALNNRHEKKDMCNLYEFDTFVE